MDQRDITGELNNYLYNLERPQYQIQMFQQKMSLEQVQDLANCIKVLGNTLSFAENYCAMNGNTLKKEFNNYDYFYASKNTEKSLYFKKFAAAIHNLDGIYDYYLSRYNEEPLPKSLSKDDIIMRLKNYKSNMENETDKSLYDDFINIFSRNSINNVHKVINNFKGDGTMDPQKIQNTFLNAKGHAEEQNQQVIEEYNKDDTYQPDIFLNAEKPSITQDNVGGSRHPDHHH